MTTFQAFLLGLLQGLTEFLPISSSAHLFLVPWFFRWEYPGLAFDVFLHGGTLLALIVYFFNDWLALARGGLASLIDRRIGFDRDRLMFWLVTVGTIPAVVAGLLLEKQVETVFRQPLLIAISLAFVGFLLYWVDGKYAASRSADELNFKDAIWIGIAQACALFPGVSRSGATITMGRLRGLGRDTAARFAFLLAFPITLGAFVHKLPDVNALASTGQLPWTQLLVGFVTSAVSGLIAIHGLLSYVRLADFRVFAWYRLLLAGAVLLWSVICNC